MVRGLLENTLTPQAVDELFANVAQRQYTRTLLFSSLVDLMGLVVIGVRPAVNAAYHARAETIGVSLKSVYNKLDNVEPNISAAWSAQRAATGGGRHGNRRHVATAVARLSRQDPRRQPSRVHRASHQGVAHDPCRGFAGTVAGRARPQLDARHRRVPL